MSQITSLYVYKVAGEASAGTQTRDLIEQLGLPPDGPIDPSKMVSSDAYYDFFEALVARDPKGLALPLRIGASMRIDDYGAFGLAWKSAPTLRGSYQRSQRYGDVLGKAERYTLEATNDGVFFSLEKAGDGRLGMQLSNEASMSAVATISNEVSSADFKPLAVHFKHSARGDASVYAAHFCCTVHFNMGRDAVLVDEAMIDAPNKLGDATISQFFDAHLEKELAALTNNDGLAQRVRIQVSQSLSEGVPAISETAAKLGMSGRTLQRRLADLGATYQDLVDAARRELAEKLLRDTDYALVEVAFLTGFSEQSAFTRAFKRWQGQTPRSYRLGD